MNVYDVIANGRVVSVVAESMGEAEKILLKIYDTATIDRIELHSEDVLLQEGEDEADE